MTPQPRPDPMLDYRPPAGPPKILHRDSHLLLVDKPSGLLSVPGKPEAHRDCLESRLRAMFPALRLVHRLDLETSGVMIFALSHLAQKALNRQFEKRVVRKTYIAQVAGRVAEEAGLIDLPLTADWPNRPRQKVCRETGRPARTGWRVLTRGPDATCLELTPETGRSHQIRVHLAELGHPILGDLLYAPLAAQVMADRLQLHAEALTFRHPTDGRWMTVRAPSSL